MNVVKTKEGLYSGYMVNLPGVVVEGNNIDEVKDRAKEMGLSWVAFLNRILKQKEPFDVKVSYEPNSFIKKSSLPVGVSLYQELQGLREWMIEQKDSYNKQVVDLLEKGKTHDTLTGMYLAFGVCLRKVEKIISPTKEVKG